MAADLVRTDRTARAAVRGWVARGGPSRFPVPPSVVGPVLREQLLSRALGERPGLVGPVIARLPAGLAGRVRDEAMAERDLFALAARSTFKPVPIVTQSPQPAAELLGDFRFAERRFGVPWHVLAAVMFVESKFGRIRSVSPAGAQGPMQFIPATWKAYGLGGDVNDPHDAVLGAANYLHARGAPADLRRALFAYNPAPLYGDAVLLFANQMERDPLAYYVLYNWQVFVHGRPATGP